MMVAMDSDGELPMGKPRPLFEDRYVRIGEFVNYAVTSDERFLMVQAQNSGGTELRIVSHLVLP
jgi:hypothetical protein